MKVPLGPFQDRVLELIRRADSFLFPPLCIVCDAPRQGHDRWLCLPCGNKIREKITARKGCPRCGQNLDFHSCICESVWDFPYDRIISFVDYDELIRVLMQEIKYRGKRHLAHYAGQLCAPYLKMRISIQIYDYIIPVPLYWSRHQRRGYNQAEWFARGLSESLGGPEVNTGILRRVRNTRSQTKLKRSQRHTNVSGAFGLSPGCSGVNGASILLIDDVITTGATSAAASEVLVSGGCEKVTVISFARD